MPPLSLELPLTLPLSFSLSFLVAPALALALALSRRVGYTVLLTSAIGYWCVNDPAPILMLLPTEADCRDYVTSDVEPLFAESPSLVTIFAPDHVGQRGRPRSGLPARNTILSRRFMGGSLKICPAKAPRNLRRHTARILLIDECDAMLASDEGAVLDLAERRTMTFKNRKIIMGGTPVNEDTSDELLRQRWPHPLGGSLRLDGAARPFGFMMRNMSRYTFTPLWPSGKCWCGSSV